MTSRAVAVLAALTATVVVAAPAAAAPKLPLGHAGRWLTDAQGRVVVTHGTNMVSKRPPYAPDATGFGADDAAFLAREGFNTVRVGVIHKALEPQPGVYDDAYLGRIAATVGMLRARGIASVLDFHQDLFNERFAGEGFPDWAVQDDGLPNQPNLGFPGNYLGMPSLQRAFDHFWDNDVVPPTPGGVGLQDRFAAAWRHVAERFRDDPGVLGYELLNEPWPGTPWQECVNPLGCAQFDAKLGAFTRRVLAAIRAVDPTTLVLYEPNVLFNDGVQTQLPKFDDRHLVFAFHDYCLLAEKLDAACPTFDDLVFTNAEGRADGTGDGLLLTEFGATDAAAVLGPMMRRADERMVSWQQWHYCACDDPTTSGPGAKQAIVVDPRRPPEGGNLVAATLGQIVRPYPQVIAGTPESWSYAPATRTFRAAWTTLRPTGSGRRFAAGTRSEVAVPPRAFPKGYLAEVRGARIVSRRNARVLRLATRSGARRVEVRVVSR